VPDEFVAVSELDDIRGLAVRLIEKQEENLVAFFEYTAKFTPSGARVASSGKCIPFATVFVVRCLRSYATL